MLFLAAALAVTVDSAVVLIFFRHCFGCCCCCCRFLSCRCRWRWGRPDAAAVTIGRCCGYHTLSLAHVCHFLSFVRIAIIYVIHTQTAIFHRLYYNLHMFVQLVCVLFCYCFLCVSLLFHFFPLWSHSTSPTQWMAHSLNDIIVIDSSKPVNWCRPIVSLLIGSHRWRVIYDKRS